MISNKTPQEIGKDFEDEVRKALDRYTQKTLTTFLRLYDTRSAGSFLPAQPGDFITCHKGKSTLIECKSSVAHKSMTNNRKILTSNFCDQQMASHRLWKRAGANCLVLFFSAQDDLIEVWDGKYVADIYFTPRARLDKTEMMTSFDRLELLNQLINYLE